MQTRKGPTKLTFRLRLDRSSLELAVAVVLSMLALAFIGGALMHHGSDTDEMALPKPTETSAKK